MIKTVENKIFQHFLSALATVEKWKQSQQSIVFTNGCFDILHYGHIHYLAEASTLADRLIIGLNSAGSVSRLKGKHRPINDDLTRTHLLAALGFVDMVVIFEEDTPYNLIKAIRPNVLVKGGDWAVSEIVGSDIVLDLGGEVQSLPFVSGYSTTNIETKIKNQIP